MLTDTTINAMLDNQFPSGAGNVYPSVHSAYSATGANCETCLARLRQHFATKE